MSTVCPRCTFINTINDYLRDGGSTRCTMCEQIYHYSAAGEAHLGSPGPGLCDKCKGTVPSLVDNLTPPPLAPPSNTEACPACGTVNSIGTLRDGGSTRCTKCSLIYHHSNNQDIHYGSPGPVMCTLCTDQMLHN